MGLGTGVKILAAAGTGDISSAVDAALTITFQ